MTTKERIVDEALALFSINGYKGTSVKNIADAVGIKDSSIYKHFKSKQEILDAIVIQMGVRVENMSSAMGMPNERNKWQVVNLYEKLTVEELQMLSRKVFLFYLQDDFVSKFWRVATMEPYHNIEFYEKFRHFFMEDSITYLTDLFAKMVQKGVFDGATPEVLAMNFYAPIFFLLNKYSGKQEKVQEALECLDKQIAEFSRCYSGI